MRAYRRKKGDKWSKDLSLKRLMVVAALNVAVGAGPFSITMGGDAAGDNLNRRRTLRRLRMMISNREIGPVFRIRDGRSNVVFIVRAVEAQPDYSGDSTNGNAKADRYWNWVRENFSDYKPSYAGAYVCKQIAGTGTLSQHSYGNAVDVFFDSLTHQDKVADAVVSNRSLLSPYHVISQRRIWTTGEGWRSYGGDFHSHLHVDFYPSYSGDCGVRP